MLELSVRHLSPGLALIAALTLAACAPSGDGIDPQGQTFDEIATDEVINLVGTEPFWGIRIADGAASYSSPDQPEGTQFDVTRFAGNNGLGFSGSMGEADVTITLTPGECSDGMSDRVFPYVATIALGEETLRGCGYTDRQPFTGDAAP
ncbi:MAG TPA: hypothetical protein VK913_05755 [Erythrobacter sp.]|nr:hypothetical protein [Erythrobacter sp.]